MRRINYADVVLDEALPFDCYDEHGNFLLRQGHVVNSEKQIEFLVDRGYFDATVTAPAAPTPKRAMAEPPHVKEAKKTPFGVFELCKEQVRTLFSKLKIDNGSKLPEDITFEALKNVYRETIRNMHGGKPSNFQEQIFGVCRGLQALCKLDQDAAIGAVHLDPLCRYTTIHPMHKAVLSEIVATRLGVSPQERLPILAAALTANISMLDLQELLHGQKSSPNEAQKRLILLHPQLSTEMLLELGVQDKVWLDSVLQHHERANGSGYHRSLKGRHILRSAQMLSLADIYGAMVKPRAYRDAIHAKEALSKIFMTRGSEVDGELVQIFIKELGIYPPGSIVRLENGEMAIVTRRGDSPTAPRVKSVFDGQGKPLDVSVSRDTSDRSYAIREIIPRDKRMSFNFPLLWDYGLAA